MLPPRPVLGLLPLLGFALLLCVAGALEEAHHVAAHGGFPDHSHFGAPAQQAALEHSHPKRALSDGWFLQSRTPVSFSAPAPAILAPICGLLAPSAVQPARSVHRLGVSRSRGPPVLA